MKRTALALCIAACSATMAHAIDYKPAMQAYFTENVAQWTTSEVLTSAVIAQNAMTDSYSDAQIQELDQAWRAEVGTGSTPTIDAVLFNVASDFLRAQVDASGGVITEVFVMDAKGLNVASSGVTSDYWQGDEAKFQKTFSMGAGAMHYSEIEFDESSQNYQAQISLTLTDAQGAVIGAMTVGVVADALM